MDGSIVSYNLYLSSVCKNILEQIAFVETS
jgi:hypothetical protein